MKKNIYKNALIIFIVCSIFLIGIGYIFNIDMLKIYSANMDDRISLISLSYSTDIAITYYAFAYTTKIAKEDKSELKFVIVFWISFICLNLIGYIFGIESLRQIWYYNNGDSLTWSFAPGLISIFVTCCYYFIDKKIISKNKSNNNTLT